MTRVKICGITRAEDAEAAILAGADALGFIFVPNSPRYLPDPTEAFRLMSDVPPFVARVAVCMSAADLSPTVLSAANAVQVYEHGSNRPESRFRLLRVMRVGASLDVELLVDLSSDADALVLDAYHPDKLGGSGETFNWQLAAEVKQRFGCPVILAGGLTPENVGDAILAVEPYAVDVSSGVESAPGVKDHARMQAFVDAVREADYQLMVRKRGR